MGRAVEGDEARDVAFIAEALGELFNTSEWDNRVFLAVEEEHRWELATDVFARASAAGVALVAEIFHANTAFGSVDNSAPEDEGIGGA